MSIRKTLGFKNLLSSINGFRFLLHKSPFSSSAASDPTSYPIFMVDFLVNSLGFTANEAISASTKVSHLTSFKNCDSVLELFKKHGFDNAQLKTLISSVPEILLHKADKTLEPKLRYFKEAGFSASDLVYLVKKDRHLFRIGLDSVIVPHVGYLRSLLGSHEKVLKVIKRTQWLLSSKRVLERLQANVMLLQGHGLSNEKIRSLVSNNPRGMLVRTETLKDIMDRVKVELAIPIESEMYSHAISALRSISPAMIEKKFEVYKSFGWSDSDTSKMARTNPLSLGVSEAKMRVGLDFFMNELGYTSAYIASRPALLAYSLEKRVKPRNEVLKILKENKLVDSNMRLYTVLPLSESKFLEKYVLPYKDVLPDLVKKYTTGFK